MQEHMKANNSYSTPMINTYSIFRKQLHPRVFNLSRSLLSKMELSTRDIFTTTCVKDQVFKSGLITPNMKANGERTKPMEEANSGMLMATSTRANGKMTKQTAMEFTFMLTELNMKDTGRTISKMDKVWNPGKTAVAMKVATKKA